MCDVVGIIAQLIRVPVILSQVWLVSLAAMLHQHDLFCYAGAMKRALEEPDAKFDIIPALKRLEVRVTARLRKANAEWVRVVVYVLVNLFLLVLAVCMSLLTAYGLPKLLAFGLIASLGLAMLFCMAAPLASVAETFEYDVVRALNNPLLLTNARRYFGD